MKNLAEKHRGGIIWSYILKNELSGYQRIRGFTDSLKEPSKMAEVSLKTTNLNE